MPGLNKDPAKAQRQLENLAKGRRALAQRVMSEGTAPEPSKGTDTPSEPPAEPRDGLAGATAGQTSVAAAPAGGSLDVPVHTYGPAPVPPKAPEPDALPLTPEQEAMTPTTQKPRRRAFMSGFLDG